MSSFFAELCWLVLGIAVKHAISHWNLRRRLRPIALAILASPKGTNDPEEACAQALVSVKRRRIRAESVQIARSVQVAALPPKPGPGGDDGTG